MEWDKEYSKNTGLPFKNRTNLEWKTVVPTVAEAGYFWMVKSDRVKVQSAFHGNGVIESIAVGGAILGNHKFVMSLPRYSIFEAREVGFKGPVHVFWDGLHVQDPWTFRGEGYVSLDRRGQRPEVIDAVEVSLPEGMLLTLDILSKGVTIKMQKQPSQSG